MLKLKKLLDFEFDDQGKKRNLKMDSIDTVMTDWFESVIEVFTGAAQQVETTS